MRVLSRRVVVVAAVVVAVAAVFLALAIGSAGGEGARGAPPERLRVPPAGQAAPAYLGDGTPVFVAHLPSGEVRVHGAWSPHLGTKLLVWCESSERFEDLFHGSRFDLAGRWHSGPAPTGLIPFAVQHRGGEVAVGPQQLPPDRQFEAGLREEQPGPDCGEGRLTGPALLHRPARVAEVHDLVGEETWRWTVAVAEPLGEARSRLCAPERAVGDGCPPGSPTLPLHLEGQHTLLVRGLGTDDAAVLVHADPAARS